MITSNKSKVRYSGLRNTLRKELFAGDLGAPGTEPSLLCGTATFHPLLIPQEPALPLTTAPQGHCSSLLLFNNKLKSLSSKIITTAVFNDKLLFLKIVLLFTFYGKVCGKRQYHFSPTILEWASLSGPDALTLAVMRVPSRWGSLIFEVSSRSSSHLKNHGEYTGTALFSLAS